MKNEIGDKFNLNESPSSPEDQAANAASSTGTSIPFEAIPGLAANEEFIASMDKLRELKQLEDQFFKKDDKHPEKDGLYHKLRRSTMAIALSFGQRSVSYQDIRIADVDGGVIKGKVSGERLLVQLGIMGSDETPLAAKEPGELIALLLGIVKAAKELDPQKLVDAGVSPLAISRAKSPDTPKANSVRVEWIGRRRGGSGTVQ